MRSQHKKCRLKSRSREDTLSLGAAFGREARGGEVIALIGELGAGKTQFVQGLAEGLGIDSSTVNSPTFTLMQVYEGRLPLTHVDLYRLEDRGAVLGLGLEEYFEDEGVAAVEWADKGEAILPAGRLVITLHDCGVDTREIELEATDSVHQFWLNRVLKQEDLLFQSGELQDCE
ncbi:MAG: tRNA (adenosine(37)-N6)-threonylcarbamoyltransferase complex ATPase subunit type 1 TsaE [Nitrospiria bacterium]